MKTEMIARDRRWWLGRRSLALATAAGLCACAGVLAQPGNNKGKAPPKGPTPPATAAPQPTVDLGEDLDIRLLKRDKARSWHLKVNVHVQGLKYAENVEGKLLPGQLELKFDTAMVLFPVIGSTATSMSMIDWKNPELDSSISFNGRKLDTTPKFQDNYHSGTRLARWEMGPCEGRSWLLDLTLPLTAYEVALDEALAMQVPWPKQWPATSASTFQPQIFVDYRERPDEKVENDKAVKKFISDVLRGKDPKSMPPAMLAKTLMGAVVQLVQVSGDARATNKSGGMEGLDLLTAAEVLEDPRVPEHSINNLMVSVYRNAGLPARLVYAWDISETKDKDKNFLERASGSAKIRSWVEFALIDPKTNREIWVPVDVVRQRKSGSRPPAINRTWKWFGNNEDAAYLLPFAHQAHPPTTVIAHGFPCFYGWLTTPLGSLQGAQQRISFTAITAPRRSGDPDPNEKQRQR